MRLALSGVSALRVMRGIRSREGRLPARRHELPSPDPSPQRRWSPGLLPLDALFLDEAPRPDRPLHVAVPSREDRLRGGFLECVTYVSGLPRNSYVEAGEGVFVPCPELLFAEMGAVMSAPVHALLGYELCGTFSRAARSPRTAPVTFDVRPATTAERISSYLDECRWVRGIDQARRVIDYVADNAWSPMEAILAVLASLPTVELGYGLGTVELNRRFETPGELVALGCRSSRVPDVLVSGTRVGFNYDGHAHLAQGDPVPAREKYVDDLRRNRELAVQGLVVLPVAAEDLFAPGGVDALMLEAALAIERLDGRPAEGVRRAVAARTLRRARQQLVWSMLPWDAARGYGLALEERARRALSRAHVEDAEV